MVEVEERRMLYRVQQGLRQALVCREELLDDWESTTEVVRETAKKVFIVASGQKG